MARARYKTTVPALRRFLIRHVGLQAPQSMPDVATAVERMAYVQMDSIPICGRLHDLILFSRVAGYQPEQLEAYLYQQRLGVEHYGPNLSIFPVEALAHVLHFMHRWRECSEGWGALRSEEERRLAREVLEWIRAQGPTAPRDLSHAGHTVNPWGARSRHSTQVLERLFAQGHVGVHTRKRFDRVYELFERLFEPVEPSSPQQAQQWRAALRLRNQGLVRLKLEEKRILANLPRVEIEAEGFPARYEIAEEQLPQLESALRLPLSQAVQLIAPLDPLIYDRERTRALFGFDYTWEVYTPAPKRKWGYYVLPLLQGDVLVGRVDIKHERTSETLVLKKLALEQGVVPAAVAAELRHRLEQLARWAGARSLRLEGCQPVSLVGALQEVPGTLPLLTV